MHYSRWRRGGTTDVPESRRRVCVIGGCGRRRYGHGYCQLHYFRWKRGNPLDSDRLNLAGVSLEERFEIQVDKSGPGGCWIWTGTINRNGYGRIVANGKPRQAHRVSWEMVNGPIPVGSSSKDRVLVCHHCDVRACVNPDHLFLGTDADNMRDMRAKGRGGAPPRKSHCKNGHPYDEENTYVTPAGDRACRECGRRIARDYQRRLRLQNREQLFAS